MYSLYRKQFQSGTAASLHDQQTSMQWLQDHDPLQPDSLHNILRGPNMQVLQQANLVQVACCLFNADWYLMYTGSNFTRSLRYLRKLLTNDPLVQQQFTVKTSINQHVKQLTLHHSKPKASNCAQGHEP